MAEGIITTAQNPNAIATVVAARTLLRLKSSTAAYAASNPSYANEVANFGKTINVPIPAEFSTNLMADGGTIVRQNPSLGNAQIVLNRHREISFEHTDINKQFATPDLQMTSMGQAVANMSEAIDADLLGIYSSFTGTAQGSYNTSLTEAVIDASETELFNQRVPAGIRKSLIVTGTGFSSLRQIARFTEADKLGGGPGSASDTFMGMLKGFMVYRAQQTVVTSTTSRHGLAMAPDALLTAFRPLGRTNMGDGMQVEVMDDNIGMRMTWSYHHEALGGLTTIDVLYGFTSGRTAHGVEVKH